MASVLCKQETYFTEHYIIPNLYSLVTIGSRALSFSDPYCHSTCVSVGLSMCLSLRSYVSLLLILSSYLLWQFFWE